ncbi:MAG: CRISPR-associated helicase Cas3' [Bacteroidales bacterium]|nr:CRISPR-associated helicase Cas3' [Bacteroidales bacterium]
MLEDDLIISHVKTDDTKGHEIQTTQVHAEGVAHLCSQFAEPFGMNTVAYLMGLLHDKGKEQPQWQRYIRYETGLSQEKAEKVPHAYVGACMAKQLFPQIAPLIGQPIAGHHRGLYDYCDYEGIIKQAIPDDITPIKDQHGITLTGAHYKQHDLHHVIRMMFSCLVDADSLDTEGFVNPEQAKLRGNRTTMAQLLDLLQKHLHDLQANAPQTEVNAIRSYVQQRCIEESHNRPGFYSLTVPTGGGKTLSSVLWALHHAVSNGQTRIIIAIPYTSIIVQTAATLKAIFGTDNVLEHHSNINPDGIEDPILSERLQLAAENWDYPIIVTTNVQLFESLFSNKRSDCRKLHNIVNSIIILDEVQTLPLEFYMPIVNTLDTLQRIFHVSTLFTTASQPILSGRIEGTNSFASFDALSSVHEIIPQEAKLHDRLRRVELQFIKDANTYDEIAKKLACHNRVLCIVNTRRDAKELYDRLPQEGICLHLSRMMCPAHISATIHRTKELLKSDVASPIRVIATQLIEAGVDIDFPVVYRQEAGLDSILQAAGRCNREGKLGVSPTYVFSLNGEHTLPRGFLQQTNNARLSIGQQPDWFAPDAMKKYFKQLHSRIDNFDKHKIKELLYKPKCEFEKAAEEFHLIDDNTDSVIINWGDSMSLVEELRDNYPTYSLMKQLAQYSVNIRHTDFDKLREAGAIEVLYESIYIVSNSKFYKSDTGLTSENQWLEETFII